MNKLFLIDAYAIIYRSYYAFIKNPRINSKGLNTSAILGFCNTLHEIIEKEQPTHIAVAFDPHGPTFRSEAYPEYKAQREETPEDIRASIPIIKDILNVMRIPVVQVDGFEADDVIGTLAKKAGSIGIETYMLTPDKDYGQLVSNNVFIYRPRHGGGYETLDEKGVCEKYEIENTSQVIDLLALMGDSADNFPGCPGVGEKTAVKLINEFGSVANLLENTDKIKGKLREKVEAAIEDIRMSYFLATIKTDVPVELDMEKMKMEKPDEVGLRKIFEELEFKTLINKFLNKSKEPQKTVSIQPDLFGLFAAEEPNEPKNSSFETLKTVAHNYKLIENEEDAAKLCDFLLTKEFLSLDTETTSTNAMEAELVGLSFAVEEHSAFYVAIPSERDKALKMVDIFKPLYENPNILKIGQNIKYDMEVLCNYDIHLKGKMWDTMIAHYLIQPELRHNMDYMASTLLNYTTIHIEEIIGAKGKNQKNMRDLSPTDIYMYACEDADITLQLKNILEQELKKEGVEQLFYEIEMPLVPVLVNMETNGVLLDTSALKQTSVLYNQRMNEIEQEIYQLAGMRFNISSPKQVGDILFKEMKLIEKPKKTKTGQYVTSEEVLESLRHKHPIVGKILDYRGLKKLLSTYIDALPELINPRTGRIHTSFNQAVTATGRLSSSNPNLQNIPVRDDDGKEIRKCFIPDPGCEFFSADYSQIELRIMAHLSGDAHLTSAFRSGEDVHAATAAKIFGIPVEEVTREQRGQAKTANFGIMYGISSFGLAQRLGMGRKEAKALIDGYFESFPAIKDFIGRNVDFARKNGYVETLFGRRRYLPDINSRNGNVRALAERNAVNAPIQGTSADIIKLAMIRVQKRLEEEGLRSRMVLQIHDELVFDAIPSEVERLKSIVVEVMEHVIELSIPLTVECSSGKNWLEAH